MRFNFQQKVMAVFLATTLSMVAGLTYFTVQERASDRGHLLEESTTKFAMNESRALSEKIKNIAQRAKVIATLKEQALATQQVVGVDLPWSSEMKAVFGLSKTQDHRLTARWIERAPQAIGWNQSLESLLGSKDPFKENSEIGVILLPQKQVGLLQGADEKILAVLDSSLFESSLNQFKSGAVSLFVVNSSGELVAHPLEHEKVNSNFTHPLISAVKEADAVSGTSEFELQGLHQVGSFEKIRGTSLYVISTATTSISKAEVFSLFSKILIFAICIFGVGFSIIKLHGSLLTNEILKISNDMASVLDGKEASLESKETGQFYLITRQLKQFKEQVFQKRLADNESEKILIKKAKLEAVEQVGWGFSEELRNPISAVLGHVQLAKNKTSNEDLKKHLDFIERETRSVRDTLERVRKSGYLNSIEMKPSDLLDLLQFGLEKNKDFFNTLGVTVHKDVFPVDQIRASSELKESLGEIVKTIAEKIGREGRKDLVVHLENGDPGQVRLRIEEPGGMTNSRKWEETLEPFSKAEGQAQPLGMALHRSVIEAHGGKIFHQERGPSESHLVIEFSTVEHFEKMEALVNKEAEKTEMKNSAAPIISGQNENALPDKEILPALDLGKKLSEILSESSKGKYDLVEIKGWQAPEPLPEIPSKSIKAIEGFNVKILPPKIRSKDA